MKKYILTLVLLGSSLCLFAQVNFLPWDTVFLSPGSEVVAIGDLNNDGLNDVVMGVEKFQDHPNSYKLFVFTQDSMGMLNPPVTYPYPTVFPGIQAISIADVNNDQLNDIVIGYGDNFGVFFQNGTGTMQPMQAFYSGARVSGLKCGDLNNDGLTDIAVSHYTDRFIHVFYQTSSSFSDSIYPGPPRPLEELDIGDVNGDGLNDVVVMTPGGHESGIHVFAQNTAGTLDGYSSYYPPAQTFDNLDGIAIGDLNNDGKNDVVATISGNRPNARIAIWFQQAGGNLKTLPLQLLAYDIPGAVEVADLDCNGQNEIIVYHQGWPEVTVYEQDSTGKYDTYSLFHTWGSAPFNPYSLAVGDINSDGVKDIAVVDRSWLGLVLLINDGKPSDGDTVTVITTETSEDTIYTNTYQDTTNYTTTITYDSNGFQVTVTDFFTITNTYHEDSVRFDTLVVAEVEFCSVRSIDSSRFSGLYHYLDLVTADTTLFSTIRDAVDLTPPDTTGQGTDTTTKVVEIKQIKLYPNPTNGPITVEFPSPYDTKSLVTTMYDARGKVVMQQTYTGDATTREFDLSPYTNGVYLLSFSIRGVNPVNFKVVKAR